MLQTAFTPIHIHQPANTHDSGSSGSANAPRTVTTTMTPISPITIANEISRLGRGRSRISLPLRCRPPSTVTCPDGVTKRISELGSKHNPKTSPRLAIIQPQEVAPSTTATGKEAMNRTDARTVANALIRGPSKEGRRRVHMDSVSQMFAEADHTVHRVARRRIRLPIRSTLQNCEEPVWSDHAGEHRHINERGKRLRNKCPNDLS